MSKSKSKCDEAEQFAYELLMPGNEVRRLVLKYREYGLSVDDLAAMCGVERDRMIARLQQLKVKLYV